MVVKILEVYDSVIRMEGLRETMEPTIGMVGVRLRLKPCTFCNTNQEWKLQVMAFCRTNSIPSETCKHCPLLY
jgi:hypothetical protein